MLIMQLYHIHCFNITSINFTFQRHFKTTMRIRYEGQCTRNFLSFVQSNGFFEQTPRLVPMCTFAVGRRGQTDHGLRTKKFDVKPTGITVPMKNVER